MSAPWLLDHAPYAPFMEPRLARPPGLSPLDPAEWTVRHGDFAAQVAYRQHLVAEVPDRVLAQRPEARGAVAEVLGLLASHLGRPSCDSLGQLAGQVAEDFCVLLPDPEGGEYRLGAALLCFPSRWLLAEKMGKPLTEIHDPVPDYDEALAKRVNRVFASVRDGHPLVRVNWLVHGVPELHLPMGVSDKLFRDADPRGPFYLRTERQTLVRLPASGAVVFGIKTSVTPIACLRPDQARALANGLAGLDAASVAYRAGASLRDNAVAALTKIACEAAPEGPCSSAT